MDRRRNAKLQSFMFVGKNVWCGICMDLLWDLYGFILIYSDSLLFFFSDHFKTCSVDIFFWGGGFGLAICKTLVFARGSRLGFEW